MADRIDRGLLLYAAGVLFGVLTVLYFSVEVVIALSPTIKAALLVVGFLVLLLVGTGIVEGSIATVCYALSAVSYLGFVLYVWIRFRPSQPELLALLGASTLLFVGLGYLVNETAFGLDRRTTVVALLAVGVITVGGVALDTTGGQPTHVVTAGEEITAGTLEPYESVAVGSLVVENEFVLSRVSDPPEFRACTYLSNGTRTGIGEEYVTVGDYESDPYGAVLRGGETRTYPMAVYGYAFLGPNESVHEDFLDAGRIPIETARDCPTRTDGVRVVIAPIEEP